MESIELRTESQLAVSNDSIKRGLRAEAVKLEADSPSLTTCSWVSRLICICPSLTLSQLPSSYLAHYGHSRLRSISLLTKQVLGRFKTNDGLKCGEFADPQLFFNIILESLIKCMGQGQSGEILGMKSLGRRIAAVLFPLRPH